jgi:hypothetical protein
MPIHEDATHYGNMQMLEWLLEKVANGVLNSMTEYQNAQMMK